MRVLFISQDLWDLVNIGYNEVTDSKEFEALLIKGAKKFIERFFLKKRSKNTLCNIPSSA